MERAPHAPPCANHATAYGVDRVRALPGGVEEWRCGGCWAWWATSPPRPALAHYPMRLEVAAAEIGAGDEGRADRSLVLPAAWLGVTVYGAAT